MASHGANNVFLSFSGEDTRHSFTDHLYYALKRAGISAFRDDEEIKRGEKLMPEIERIIEESRASVVVISKNYAASTWCLDELLLILKQRTECTHFVLPVFYHVDPSDVRKHRKTFAIEVKASSRWTDHNVNMWKKALTEVADLAGMVLSGSEAKLSAEIVNVIYDKLDRREVNLPRNITGMATRYAEISTWFDRPDVEFLAICGMGGSGKTTLAKYIYNSKWKTYENMSFVEGISRICERSDGLRMVQEQLLKGILGGKKRKIPSVFDGTWEIKEALQTKKSLIVLDDIAEDSQLVALLGTGKINAQSKIIITTARENTDNWFKSTNWRCQDYKMKLLNGDESIELLSRHAFGSKSPMEGFEELADRAVRYCEGNPFALEVLASSLSDNNTILHWTSQLNLLENDIDSSIQTLLITSYNSLSFHLEKELFLHIACFFVGIDMDYAVKILEHNYPALSGIKSLSNRCLISVSPNNKLMMHRLLQEMGKNIVRQQSTFPAERSRVWLSGESYKILTKGEGSKTMEGLALDMQMLDKQKFALKSSNLKTDALQKMDRLKLLQLNSVQLTGTYENFSEDLRWLCWLGSDLRTIPSDLFMGNLVAMDMSCSKLEVFEPPMVLQSLQILNLSHSHDLSEIRSMSMIPRLETLILWNCHSLARVCETIGDLKSLALLNMTGCRNLCKSEQKDVDLEASTSGGEVAENSTFSFPSSLHRLFLKDCNLDCTDSFPLSFSTQPSLQYLNLGNGLFEFLPCYDHLKNLRVLDLSSCSMLKRLPCLPSTLAELYIYYCKSVEEISFQSHRFTLQEFGYEGCISLLEIEGFIKLVPVAKLEGNDLGHMKWLKEYENHEVRLVGDDELTKGRSLRIQMLYEFNIMSTSLPEMKDPNMKPTYVSELSSLSFEVPPPPDNTRLKGLDVTFKYTISGDDDWVWFCKISTTNGVDLMYNPKVFGKPESGEVGVWLSYWPIGNRLDTGDKVNVSIAVINGLEVHECGVSLVYTDDKVAEESLENNVEWIEVLGGDLSGFQLSTGAYYLCRCDLFELMEVGRLTPGWFSILVGDTIECTEVRGWRKTGRPMQFNPSFTELKFVRCILHGPESEDIYRITEMSKSSIVDKTLEFPSSLLGETMESSTSSKFRETTIEELNEIKESSYTTHGEKLKSTATHGVTGETEVNLESFLIPLKEINLATKGFSPETQIGEGGFGFVYKGQLSERWQNCIVAVKRFGMKGHQGSKEFLTELKLISSIHHENIIRFIGYCDEDSEMILVFDYASNHSLDHHLQDSNKRSCLTWSQRLKICLGAARGLNHLHSGLGEDNRVIHRDIKSGNILLDGNLGAKICDFGLSKESLKKHQYSQVYTKVAGTNFYLDPIYQESGILSKESDVYSFGVVMFEILSGMLAYSLRSIGDGKPRTLMSLVRKCNTYDLDNLVDPLIRDQTNIRSLYAFTILANECVAYNSEKRPTMDTIIKRIENALEYHVPFYRMHRFLKLENALENAPAMRRHTLSPMADACLRTDLTAIHEILIDTHYKGDEGVNEPSFQEWIEPVQATLNARKQGDLAFRDKDFRSAIEFYSTFINDGRFPSPTVHIRRSLCHLMCDQLAAALQDAMLAQLLHVEWPVVLYMQAVTLAMLDSHTDAVNMFNEAAALEDKKNARFSFSSSS